jgi:small-conductance mechanosensitive channel
MFCHLLGQGIARAGCVAAFAIALVFAGLAAAPAQQPAPPASAAAPEQSQPDPAAGIDALKTAVERVEKTFKESLHSEDALAALKGRLTPLSDQLNERIGEIEQRLKFNTQRASQLGPPPAAGATEDESIAAERQRLAKRHAELETALRQVKLLADQVNGIEEGIRHRLRNLFTGRVFARSKSLFDRAFWNELLKAVPTELNGLTVLASSWAAYARANGGIGGAAVAAALLAVLGVAAWFLARWRRRLTAGPTPRRFDKAAVAFIRVVSGGVKFPALVGGTVLVLRNFGLMPDSIVEIGFALTIAVLIAGIGRGVAAGLFAPGEPDRRIITLTEQEAASYASHLVWAARFTGLAILANEVLRILGASVAPVVAVGEVQAFALLVITVHLLWRTAQVRYGESEADTAGPQQRGWLRIVLWLCCITILVGLATGYVSFVVFVANRVLAALAVGGAVYVVITLIDAALTDLLAAGTPGGRSVAAAFGVSPRGLDLVNTLASATLRLVIAALALVVALNVTGIWTDDVVSALKRVVSDYDIGAVHISPIAILWALAFLIVGGLAVRAAQRWLSVNFLPRTGLEAGLQNSIVALSGYLALIVVLAACLGIVGIDLQKIALIAGALSVGIGFGLQSVVSNFVSGLILLAERSIRVGDWVVVKNEEGFVRRISIRSTEIETFDRSTVIVPNQEFITGVVKNWTHSNTVGRIVIKIRVAFDSDVQRVRELLLEAAVKHPQVLPGTPNVYVMGFGDIGIDVDLMCLVGNISQGLTVKTELYMDILGKLRDARIRIPAPIHEASVPSVPVQAQAAPKIA